jgi:ribonuclease T1
MRAAFRLAAFLALLLAALSDATAASDQVLGEFASREGLRDVAGFIATIRSIEMTDRLPVDRYVTKRQAEAEGWHGGDLCRVMRGRTIGGDVFRNAEGQLPTKSGRTWHEADLDYSCGSRGAKRLVFSSDGQKYVTVDHYRTFQRVPD